LQHKAGISSKTKKNKIAQKEAKINLAQTNNPEVAKGFSISIKHKLCT
jgi:hypothetical protein